MNTRLFNLAAAARITRSRGSSDQKRRRTTQNSRHERAQTEDEFDTVRWREESLNSRKRVVTTTEREAVRDDTWSASNSWLPEDSTEFGLDAESAWFDEDQDGSVFIEIQPPLPAAGKKRSVVSVSGLFHPRQFTSNPLIESSTPSMDARISG